MAKPEIHNQEPSSQYHAPGHKGPFERKTVLPTTHNINQGEKRSAKKRPVIIIDVHRPKA